MITERVRIYRRILHVGMVDIRNFSHKACLPQREETAFAPWLTATECMECVSGLAEWLHDLASHSYHQFDGWTNYDESAFMANYHTFRAAFASNKYPALVHDVVKLLG